MSELSLYLFIFCRFQNRRVKHKKEFNPSGDEPEGDVFSPKNKRINVESAETSGPLNHKSTESIKRCKCSSSASIDKLRKVESPSFSPSSHQVDLVTMEPRISDKKHKFA